MHDGMQYDPILGQAIESRKIRPFSKAISSPIYHGAGK